MKSGWLVSVSGELTDQVETALVGRGMAVAGRHHAGAEETATRFGFTVRVVADNADFAAVEVGAVLRPWPNLRIEDVMPAAG